MQLIRMCVAVVLCAGLLGCAAGPAPTALGEVQPGSTVAPLLASTSSSRDLRVMSFNLRVPFILDAWNFWPLRRDLAAQAIREFNPDLLGTQELVKSSAEYLREQLPEYDFVGVGRNNGKDRGEMCGMFFKRDRFTKLNEGHFWLSTTPAKAGSRSWGSGQPRMVSWVRLRPIDGGEVFFWFNTHFDNGSGTARLESAKLLRQEIAAIAGSAPVLVTGDFNAAGGSAPYRELVRGDDGLSDLFDVVRAALPGTHRDLGTMHDFHGGKNGPRIDWVLANAEFSAVSAAVDHTQRGVQFPSDHFPVKAVLRMNGAPANNIARIE